MSPAFGASTVGVAVFSAGAFGPTVAFASSDGSLSPSFATTLISSFSANSLPSGNVAVQFPLSSAFTLISVPSGSFTVTSDPAGAVPLISLSPAFGASTVGVAVFSSGAFATVASSLAGFFPASVCSAVTFSPSTNLSAGMSLTVQLPSLSTVASPILLPSLSFNTTVAPATPVPDTLVSPAFGAVIVGFALVSCAPSFQTA